jgi:thymidylate synthase (FAD)
MKIERPKVIIESKINRTQILKKLEQCGRVCYKSENKITDDSASAFVTKLVRSGHLSVIEHISLTAKFITDRGISHELVRHRISSYSQESSRYCNYGNGGLAVILPGDISPEMTDSVHQEWEAAVKEAERSYLNMIQMEVAPQIARSVLPTCTKTEIVATANLREWRLILEQRTSTAAHPDMRRLMRPLLRYLRLQLPEIFPETLGDDTELPPMAELIHHKDDVIPEVLCK